MSLREDVARRAFVWGRPTVALHGLLHALVLAPARDGEESRWHRPLPGPPPVRAAGLPTLAALGTASSCTWLDLRHGPVRLVVPPQATARPPSVTLLDLYADVLGRGREDVGPTGGGVLVVGPSWDPVVPGDVVAVLRCPTDLCLVVCGNGVEVGVEVEAARPPGRGRPAPGPLPAPLPASVAPVDVALPPTTDFLVVLDRMLPLMPTRPGDEDLRADLEVVGVGVGPSALAEALAEDRHDGEVTAGLRRGFEDVRRAQMSSSSRPRRTASWARATDSLR